MPYIYGGNNPLTGWDCSGFVIEILRSFGLVKGDHTCQGLYKYLSQKNWRSQLAEGSILFFGESRNQIVHIAIALNKSIMIECGGGVSSTRTLTLAKRRGACVRIRPIRNTVAVLKPEPNIIYDKKNLL